MVDDKYIKISPAISSTITIQAPISRLKTAAMETMHQTCALGLGPPPREPCPSCGLGSGGEGFEPGDTGLGDEGGGYRGECAPGSSE